MTTSIVSIGASMKQHVVSPVRTNDKVLWAVVDFDLIDVVDFLCASKLPS